jgi:plastocyanin
MPEKRAAKPEKSHINSGRILAPPLERGHSRPQQPQISQRYTQETGSNLAADRNVHAPVRWQYGETPRDSLRRLFSCHLVGLWQYLCFVTCCTAMRFVCAALLLGGTTFAYGQAEVEGKVSLPKPEPMELPTARYAGQVGEIEPPDLPRAVVYLEGQFPNADTNAVQKEVLQKGMQFHPALLPVQVGTTVAFPNGDDFYHNVFSYSKTKRFDLGRYRKTDRPPPVEVFDKPGVVKLYCEIHQHMRGIILVLDTPHFTRTETNGLYKLEGLPAGQYTLKAWVDEKHVYEKPVSLEPGKTLHLDFDAK